VGTDYRASAPVRRLKAVPLSSLTGAQRRIILALIAAAEAAERVRAEKADAA
jgi:hypothetical protein